MLSLPLRLQGVARQTRVMLQQFAASQTTLPRVQHTTPKLLLSRQRPTWPFGNRYTGTHMRQLACTQHCVLQWPFPGCIWRGHSGKSHAWYAGARLASIATSVHLRCKQVCTRLLQDGLYPTCRNLLHPATTAHCQPCSRHKCCTACLNPLLHNAVPQTRVIFGHLAATQSTSTSKYVWPEICAHRSRYLQRARLAEGQRGGKRPHRAPAESWWRVTLQSKRGHRRRIGGKD
jgi:hypothetical protein